MNIFENIKENIRFLKGNITENEYLYEDISYSAFILSLSPIPGPQQLGQIVDRISTNKILKIKFGDIWKKIKEANENILNIENELEKIKEIGVVINSKSELNEMVKGLIEDINQGSEFSIETKDWSYQEVINSIIEADLVRITAANNSTNVVEDSEIKSRKAKLTASDGSRNFFNNTNFTGTQGSVGMNGISTIGDVEVTESSVGLKSGSAIVFGANPNIISGTCSCGHKVEVDKRNLVGYTQIQCPNCKTTMPFSIN